MTTYKQLSAEQKAQLDSPLPAEAVTQHPTKTFLSSIKSIYVTERLNEVFGVGAWRTKTEKIAEGNGGMIVVKVSLSIPEYGIEYESFGGNNNGGEGSKNFDLGDAYKGAVTDAITKIASWMGIGADVFKGKQTASKTPTQPAQPKQKPSLLPYKLPSGFLERMYAIEQECIAKGEKFRMNNIIEAHYLITSEDYHKVCNLYESFKVAKFEQEFNKEMDKPE
jgi:hypothetical protein